ncbi:AntA/AntB antirepressor [Edwardsiella ictaluri]|uniref:AntA/AntB antirepressor n=1 Tax=Edwardsiella ictaluri (strain 93-146) TaxID=634503 RepID=C5BH30_EDWI9|nr:antA/AntB antirepressor family protein [Edwardsiella ictaluri]ACR69461.2 AntA/AntB antirepressor [Edwardsiella ictaluri 93-146]AVZ83529.1 AntA/AntB antirepressor [Edwardsiella ictaluri]EKS7764179.1 antA/AntB antirepressor family protein [Edwardsiella ictaluri]EKS7771038.1 antA/AntB antirepressor family protein [Edwardsiella ictaluri]EKS7774130.1 antA/AntB antirepressor family protein [Edwardsiella ictaluri]
MTTQLIPVFNGTISNESTLLCNARDLHKFLGVGKRFASWVTERIAEYEFVENQDYIIISQNREIIKRGRPTTDYHLTLDTAKELAMVERNERGRQIRRYFIDCERRLIKKSTVIKKAISREEIDAYNINALSLHYREIFSAWRERIYPALRQLESPIAGRLYDRFIDGAAFLSYVERSLNERLLPGQRPRIM